jgi:hypothetical protein
LGADDDTVEYKRENNFYYIPNSQIWGARW